MKILITGGAGFIGSHLADSLIEKGHRMIIVDDLSSGLMENVDHRSRFFGGNVMMDFIFPLVEEADFVFHLAADVGFLKVMRDPVRTLIRNIVGTRKVFDACIKFKKPCIFMSSSETYADKPRIPMKEVRNLVYRCPINVKHGYGLSKLVGEYMAAYHRQSSGADIRVVRLFNTAGPRQLPDYGMVLPRFVYSALKDELITIYGSGHQSRTFCHVGDIIRGLCLAMENGNAFSDGLPINLGGIYSVSMNGLAELVSEIVGKKGLVIYKGHEDVYGKGFRDVEIRIPDISRAKELLSWYPELSLSQIIMDTVGYWRARI